MDVTISDEVSALGAWIEYRYLKNVKVLDPLPEEKEIVERLRNLVASKYPSPDKIKESPVLSAYRKFMWKIGIDPTKVRVASEALIRRLVRRGEIPLINNVVDAGNFASIETEVPIGIYDADKIVPPLTLRRAREGESFHDLAGKLRTLKGGEVVLADKQGVIHVFPHRDSQRTCITKSTKSIVIVACGVPGVSKDLVANAVERVVHYLKLLHALEEP